MSVLQYNFDDNGETTDVQVAFSTYTGIENFSARVVLTNEYVQSINENVSLDTMNKEQIDNFARRYLRDWVMTAPDEVVEEAPTEAPAE